MTNGCTFSVNIRVRDRKTEKRIQKEADMFKIEIQADDGRELKMSKGSFIYFKDAGGNDSYWEWEHIAGIAAEFDPLFARAVDLVDEAQKTLPDLPMSGVR
jgi:hypothetical protein